MLYSLPSVSGPVAGGPAGNPVLGEPQHGDALALCSDRHAMALAPIASILATLGRRRRTARCRVVGIGSPSITTTWWRSTNADAGSHVMLEIGWWVVFCRPARLSRMLTASHRSVPVTTFGGPVEIQVREGFLALPRPRVQSE